jgi:His-Xaa-Ser system radical SAM maturase HxsC
VILGVHGKWLHPPPNAIMGRVTLAGTSEADRRDHILICDPEGARSACGYAAVLCNGDAPEFTQVPLVHSVRVDHLSVDDVVSIDPRGYVRTLYRRTSPHNWIFATDRCNSLCLMCSQPPKDVDEPGIVGRHLRLVDLMHPDTKDLGISGGEPSLLGDGLVQIIKACRDRLPRTALHILSNGRLFRDKNFAAAIASVAHPDLMIGVPLYADNDGDHDYVVQSRGAFAETLAGLHNLAAYDVPVEIRVVIHRATYQRLPQLAEFLYRNVTFASQVALMGLEITGYTVPNLSELWIDPSDYSDKLRNATLFLSARGMSVWIYNHQLCTLPRELWPFARKTISDWKNEYMPVCDGCAVHDECGGFFASAVSRRCVSRMIAPITGPAAGAGSLRTATYGA